MDTIWKRQPFFVENGRLLISQTVVFTHLNCGEQSPKQNIQPGLEVEHGMR